LGEFPQLGKQTFGSGILFINYKDGAETFESRGIAIRVEVLRAGYP
jgi:hypothetical protein